MRLAILMSLASPWAKEAVLRLSELGHSIHIVSFDRTMPGGDYASINDDLCTSSITSLRKSVAGLHLIESPFSSSLRYFTSALRLKKILRTCGAEALLTLCGGGHAAMAYLSGFRPYAIYAVGSDILMASAIKRGIGRIALNAASSIFVNGAHLTQKTRELVPRAHPIPLYLGVDTSRFSPDSPHAGPVRVICTRGFLPVYNNMYLVRGLAVMPEPTPDFTVTFVSRGPLLVRARALADELLPAHIRRNVDFLGGVSNACLLESLRHADIFVSVSRSDGTSSSLLEALACGLFPVLSDIPQNREWVDLEANNGILVPLDQPRALASALIRAILDHGWRRRAAEYNRLLAVERASSHRNMAVLASKLESMIRSHATNGDAHAD